MNAADWLKTHPGIETLYIAAADLNGVARGKRCPVSAGPAILTGGTRFPKSVLNLDIFGDDIKGSPLVLASGDQDGLLHVTERGQVPMPWLKTPSALLPLWMSDNSGAPFPGDPRHALSTIENRFQAKGLEPVVAAELEFFLMDDSGDAPAAPVSQMSGKRRIAGDILSLQALETFEAFFSDLYVGCAAMDIPAETAISESGLGQFEVNLLHQPSLLKAADDVWLFKMLVKGIARKHGMCASFMAKPYPDWSGSGMHIHASVLDKAGRNIFDDGTEAGTPALRHAIAGCLAAMPASTLIFAPHANSYARFIPGAHAPTAVSWAYENRTSAIRVPVSAPAARRFEHRVAAGDVNPYLSLAVILGAALNGLEATTEPPAPVTGNAYAQDLPQIPTTWPEAIEAFEHSPEMADIFPKLLIENLVMTKRQELERMADLTEAEQVALYLDSV